MVHAIGAVEAAALAPSPNAVKHFWLENRQVSYKELRMFLPRFAFGTLNRRVEIP